MGRTKKPCPGCKKVYGWRPADDVCNRCRQLIKEAKEQRALLENKPDYESALLGPAHHWNEEYYSADCDGDLRDELSKAMYELALCLSEKNRIKVRSNKALPLLGKASNTHLDEGYRYIRSDRARAIRKVHSLIRKVMVSCWKKGKGEGHDLLSRLATGDLAINEFFEKTEGS